MFVYTTIYPKKLMFSAVGRGLAGLWIRIFYFPADATINGLVFLAESTKFHALKRDLRLAAGAKDSIVMGFFALLWWILILKAVLRFGRSVRGTNTQDPSGELGPGAAGLEQLRSRTMKYVTRSMAKGGPNV